MSRRTNREGGRERKRVPQLTLEERERESERQVLAEAQGRVEDAMVFYFREGHMYIQRCQEGGRCKAVPDAVKFHMGYPLVMDEKLTENIKTTHQNMCGYVHSKANRPRLGYRMKNKGFSDILAEIRGMTEDVLQLVHPTSRTILRLDGSDDLERLVSYFWARAVRFEYEGNIDPELCRQYLLRPLTGPMWRRAPTVIGTDSVAAFAQSPGALQRDRQARVDDIFAAADLPDATVPVVPHGIGSMMGEKGRERERERGIETGWVSGDVMIEEERERDVPMGRGWSAGVRERQREPLQTNADRSFFDRLYLSLPAARQWTHTVRLNPTQEEAAVVARRTRGILEIKAVLHRITMMVEIYQRLIGGHIPASQVYTYVQRYMRLLRDPTYEREFMPVQVSVARPRTADPAKRPLARNSATPRAKRSLRPRPITTGAALPPLPPGSRHRDRVVKQEDTESCVSITGYSLSPGLGKCSDPEAFRKEQVRERERAAQVRRERERDAESYQPVLIGSEEYHDSVASAPPQQFPSTHPLLGGTDDIAGPLDPARWSAHYEIMRENMEKQREKQRERERVRQRGGRAPNEGLVVGPAPPEAPSSPFRVGERVGMMSVDPHLHSPATSLGQSAGTVETVVERPPSETLVQAQQRYFGVPAMRTVHLAHDPSLLGPLVTAADTDTPEVTPVHFHSLGTVGTVSGTLTPEVTPAQTLPQTQQPYLLLVPELPQAQHRLLIDVPQFGAAPLPPPEEPHGAQPGNSLYHSDSLFMGGGTGTKRDKEEGDK
ncbi:hypothetical protein KIPB_001147 [Kipferlia bialata]|uniref:Uncharacterized protein n=1 Tax=Kipferlia bialata TaxID=797122 RepID=A0A9K3CPW2_9EUKA|nr:hypothetical protein KIPB_001147 [Kipferlia bialata]|eukprot:g1147.t1